MKAFLIFCVSVLSITTVFAQQKSTIRILGEHKETVAPTTWAMSVILSEDPSLCDPVKGFMSLEQQLDGFVQALSSNGLTSYTVKELPLSTKTAFPRRQHEFRSNDPEVAYGLKRLAKEARVTPKFYFVYEGLRFEGEDPRALAAYRNAERRAMAIAKSEGYSSLRLLSIDDDTINSSCEGCFEFSSSSINYWHNSDLLNLLAYLSKDRKDAAGTLFSPDPTYQSNYQLWVEFEVVQ
ncbi:MAG: hypothetical protein AB8F78_10900 [Saprospiraceae bacterium]